MNKKRRADTAALASVAETESARRRGSPLSARAGSAPLAALVRGAAEGCRQPSAHGGLIGRARPAWFRFAWPARRRSAARGARARPAHPISRRVTRLAGADGDRDVDAKPVEQELPPDVAAAFDLDVGVDEPRPEPTVDGAERSLAPLSCQTSTRRRLAPSPSRLHRTSRAGPVPGVPLYFSAFVASSWKVRPSACVAASSSETGGPSSRTDSSSLPNTWPSSCSSSSRSLRGHLQPSRGAGPRAPPAAAAGRGTLAVSSNITVSRLRVRGSRPPGSCRPCGTAPTRARG
jgi:hypothetical protein